MKKILLVISFFITYLSNSQETYTIGKTEYYYNQYYSTTGKPVVKRNETNKKIFLRSLGYSETPNGYQIDHITPLSEGGTDDPSNMQLLTISLHKSKTARERANRSTSTITSSTNSYYENSNYINSYEEPITTADYSRTENGRIIYKGTSGGEYYVNNSGNKVYVKSNTSNSTSSNYSSTLNSSYYSSSPYSTPSSSTSRDIQTGSRGGQYYINSNGNKTYVKK
ncbi:HNH endonuclease signature motif containing protein [Flavobacterium tyrosinilyticum]|uniref:HNH endonuclease signature motif containing protein n=1 Tax=Flavobacterium tyrosinilyticum TaxID=1658740 RepID=UPI00202EA0DD|nr:HNH endonuclease signature motif containing protein [Flavobacterium tyrosinilyticum]MCM0666556.1 HNH endonuclease [Flavobacterium tyrosinilyticum]